MNGLKPLGKINGLIVLFLFLVLILPVIFIFSFDLNAYFIPKPELNRFYVYSFLYSILGILASAIIGRIFRKDQKSSLPSALRLIIGILWVVDGILQFQPEMPYGFLSFVIGPSIQSINNLSVENFLMIGYNLWLIHPFQFDALSGALQIFIGFSYLINDKRKALKYISIFSIIWSLVIWVFGEGFGGIPESGVSLLKGFPGSALIYILLSIPFISPKFENAKYLRNFFLHFTSAIFIIGAFLQLIPGNTFWSRGQISFDIFMNIQQQGENPVVYFILNHAYVYFIYREDYLNVFMFLLMFAIGIMVLLNIRGGLILAMIFTGITWVLFQDMGIFINPATDPNTGLPLLMMIAVLLILERSADGKSHNNTLQGNNVLST